MATRYDIRVAFYDELETALDGVLPAEKITGEYPDSEEELPQLVHSDSYRRTPMNNGTAPTNVVSDSAGEQVYQYARMKEGVFALTIASETELEKEDIYNAVYSHFEAYTRPYKSPSEIHEDIHHVELGDVTDASDENRTGTLRGDRLEVTLGYQRLSDRDVTPTDSVDQSTDLDSDGTIDIENTIE